MREIVIESKSETALRHRRRAVTLAEVLIAMGIMTLGLLGVASLFPVGGFYMQSGDVADASGSLAQAALDDAIVRGHLNPENWVAIDIDGLFVGGANAGQVSRLTDSLRAVSTNFSKLEASGSPPVIGGLQEPAFRNWLHGSAYVIDPMGMAAALETEVDDDSWRAIFSSATQPNSETARRFPATRGLKYSASEWNTWATLGPLWPVRRVTTTVDPAWFQPGFVRPETHQRLLPAARALFTTQNDLSLSLPTNGDDPARARWQTWRDSSETYVSARQSKGEYSWLITVSPGSSEARDSLASQPDAYPMEVSVVVFHKRVLGLGSSGALESERLVKAKVVSTGTAGGELLLERFYEDDAPNSRSDLEVGAGEPSTSPFEELQSGQYVMLTGPHPQSTQTNPLFVMRWYRVLSIEDDGVPSMPDATMSVDNRRLDRESRVLVSLRGPDWPWLPGRSGSQIDLETETLLSNDLRVAIVPGIVSVYTKTMRLEAGSQWAID